ncbi:unnamed protein product [Diatraea saccharalis]|uniref:Uncharacterized protein n=1 Tax=Diatraea saccharalis TaxID=40085 RepID=A0A9N9R006_9NEOP|nr:unnamed protein product [Diatraea saccharalis]
MLENSRNKMRLRKLLDVSQGRTRSHVNEMRETKISEIMDTENEKLTLETSNRSKMKKRVFKTLEMWEQRRPQVIVQMIHTFSLINNNGWTPLTQEEVMRTMDSEFTRRSFVNQYNNIPLYGYPTQSVKLKENAIKLLLPKRYLQIEKESFNPIDAKKEVGIPFQNTQKYYSDKDHVLYQQEDSNTDFVSKKNETDIIEISNRTPKSLFISTDLTKHVSKKAKENMIVVGKQNIVEPDLYLKLKADTERNGNVYEVTEDISDVPEERMNSKKSGYIYKPPEFNVETSTKVNSSNLLLNILTKYNIGLEDDLPNYTLSRLTKGPRPNFMSVFNPMNVLYGFKSFNNLIKDPSLAVYLSNYGYYLPGSYGIQNKYRNLYGYLASNNIHNNMPFGSYKIYSDTDSSN